MNIKTKSQITVQSLTYLTSYQQCLQNLKILDFDFSEFSIIFFFLFKNLENIY